MSLAIVYSRAQDGINAPQVTVEVHLTNGLPGLSIVGLPETAVKESKDRVRSALINSNFEFPTRRITINMAPADMPKEGGRFDLAIAIGILAASGQIPAAPLKHIEFIGELALSGELRDARGVLPVAIRARDAGRKLIAPLANADEAALANGAEIYPASNLLEVCAHINGSCPLTVHTREAPAATPDDELDISDVRAQHRAKRALEIAAAGGHNLLMIGPPGTGKTMLANRLSNLLPQMNEQEALETAAVASVSRQGFNTSNWMQRPFRAPHHTASGIALVGGGAHPSPGEISLAHNGVIFLDELPEFSRKVLEVLREPLESGKITISRATHQAEFPASFQLIAAMNPCPCGYLGDSSGRCRCTQDQIQRYRARVSGPLLDRIDLHVEVPNVSKEVLNSNTTPVNNNNRELRARINNTRTIQLRRSGKPNNALNNKEIASVCKLSSDNKRLLEQAVQKLRLSARGLHRILKVARTIADMENSESIRSSHLTEALSYRPSERIQP